MLDKLTENQKRYMQGGVVVLVLAAGAYYYYYHQRSEKLSKCASSDGDNKQEPRGEITGNLYPWTSCVSNTFEDCEKSTFSSQNGCVVRDARYP